MFIVDKSLQDAPATSPPLTVPEAIAAVLIAASWSMAW
jgi:hypothetical protein